MWPLLSYTLFTSCACYAGYPSNLDTGWTCQWLVRLLMCVLIPPSSDHFSRDGVLNFEAGNLICKKVSLNQKNWSPNGEQAKTLTWRLGS